MPLLVGLLAGVGIGVGAALAFDDDAEPASASGPRILCETDAARIAEAYEEQGLGLSLLINCQEASHDAESPLAGATLEPEYRCFLGVQQGTNSHLLDCAPMPGPPRP